MKSQEIPIIFFLGPSGSGKTTSIEKIITKLNENTISVGTIKFIHHPTLTLDPVGKDSNRDKQAGALYTLNFAPKESVIIINKEHRETINDVKRILEQSGNILPSVDVILCESLNNPPPKSNVFISANSISDIDQYLEPLEECMILAILGTISNIQNIPSQYKGIPLYSALNEQDLIKITKKILKISIEKRFL